MTTKLPPGVKWGDDDDDDVLSTSTFVKPKTQPDDTEVTLDDEAS